MAKNAIKEKPQPEEKPKQKSNGGNIVTRTVGSVMSGSFLSREQTVRALPFIFFLTFITLCYIANGYYAEEQIRKLNKYSNDLKELHSEYIVSKSDLSAMSTREPVAQRVKSLGLRDSLQVPFVIQVSTDTAKHAR